MSNFRANRRDRNFHPLARIFSIAPVDNASMERLDQMQARKTTAKFVEQNAGDDRLVAVAEFGGSLHTKQDFTANAEVLMSAISGSHTPHL